MEGDLESERNRSNNDQGDTIGDINLEDTQDRRLKKQSDNYMKMMKNLIMIQGEIEQQIQLIRFSK